MSLLRILLPVAFVSGVSVAAAACSGQVAPVLTSPDGATDDAGPRPDASPEPNRDSGGPDGAVCPGGESIWYAAPGCGVDAVGTCGTAPPPCADEYCSCTGKTVIGCGVVSEPFAHAGPCAADIDTCTKNGGSCGPISDCDRGEGQLGGTAYSCGIAAPGTGTCCFKPGTPCGDAADFDCCQSNGAVSRPVCQAASGTLGCLSGTMAPVGACP